MRKPSQPERPRLADIRVEKHFLFPVFERVRVFPSEDGKVNQMFVESILGEPIDISDEPDLLTITNAYTEARQALLDHYRVAAFKQKLDELAQQGKLKP